MHCARTAYGPGMHVSVGSVITLVTAVAVLKRVQSPFVNVSMETASRPHVKRALFAGYGSTPSTVWHTPAA